MLPAAELTEIVANLAALQLEPNIAAQVIAAVIPPLLRSSGPPAAPLGPARSASSHRRAGPRSKPGGRRKRKYERHAPTEARDRALAALKANPDATPSQIARQAGVSRSTAVHARKQLAKEERKAARKNKSRATSTPVQPTDRRSRAQHFLRRELADGPVQVSAVEAAASKAHIDTTALEQARADLGIVASRANAGGVQAVQWSLPG